MKIAEAHVGRPVGMPSDWFAIDAYYLLNEAEEVGESLDLLLLAKPKPNNIILPS